MLHSNRSSALFNRALCLAIPFCIWGAPASARTHATARARRVKAAPLPTPSAAKVAVAKAPTTSAVVPWLLPLPTPENETKFLQNQLAALRRTSQERLKALSLVQLAGVEARLGLLDDAENHAAAAQRIAQRIRANDELAGAFFWQSHLAILRRDSGDARIKWAQAMGLSSPAMRLALCREAAFRLGWEEIAPDFLLDAARTGGRLTGNAQEMTVFRERSGRALWELGLRQSALDCWRQLRSSTLKRPDAGRCAAALSESEAKLFLGDNDAALRLASLATIFLPPKGEWSGELLVRQKLALVRTALSPDLASDAVRNSAQAVTAANQLGEAGAAWQVEALILQSQAFFLKDDADSALQSAQKAVQLAESPLAVQWRQAAALAQSRALWAKGARDTALESLLTALKQRSGTQFGTARSCSFDSNEPDRQAVQWLLESKRAPEAWAVAEVARQWTLGGPLHQASLATLGLPPEDAGKYWKAMGQVWAIRRITPRLDTPRATRLDAAQNQYGDQSLALASLQPAIDWENGNREVDSQALIQKLGDNGALISLFPLNYSPGEETDRDDVPTAYFQVTVRFGKLDIQGGIIAPSQPMLKAVVSTCRDARQDATTPLRDLSVRLQPAFTNLERYPRIYISPGGSWWQLPFAALPDANGRALLMSHAIQIVPGAFWLTRAPVAATAGTMTGQNQAEAANPTTPETDATNAETQSPAADSNQGASLLILNPKFASPEMAARNGLPAELESPLSLWPSSQDVVVDARDLGAGGRGLPADGRGIVADGRVFGDSTDAMGRPLVANGRSLALSPWLPKGGLRPLGESTIQSDAFVDIPTTALSGPEASEENFQAALKVGGAPSSVLWGGSHLLWSEARPFESGLALAAPALHKTASSSDGLWSWREAALSRTNLSVVLWSKSDTLADENGDGQIAMLWALNEAGSGGVAWTLWCGNDATTTLFARAFLGQRQAGQSASTAFLAAQRTIAARSEFSHPFYWANWRFAGDS